MMKIMRWALFALVIAVRVSFSQDTVPRYPIQKSDASLVLDGKLTDEIWKSLPDMGPFLDRESSFVFPQTEVKIFRKANDLYFGIRCEEPQMDRILKSASKNDADVEKDDSMILILSPSDNGMPYYRFLLNSRGIKEEGVKQDPSNIWDVPWEVMTAVGEKEWTAEVKIPLEVFAVAIPGHGAVWRMNVYRNRAHMKTMSSWANTNGEIYSNHLFGEAIFLDSIQVHQVTHQLKKVLGEGLKSGLSKNYYSGKPPEFNLDHAEGVTVEVKMNAVEGSYQLYCRWENDSVEVKPIYPGIATDVSLVGSTEYTNIVVGDHSTTQYQIGSKQGSNEVLYRSPYFLVHKTDPREKIIAQIKTKLELNEVKGLKDLENWKVRLDSLGSQGAIEGLNALYQEVRFAVWKLKNKIPEGTPFFVGSVPPFIHEDWLLADDYLPEKFSTVMKLKGVLGESELGTLLLTNLSPIQEKEVSVKVTDLRSSSGGIISSQKIDLRILKNWYQAGKGGFQNADGSSEYVSELLVKDDRMIKVDHVKRSNEVITIQEPAELSSFLVLPFNTRQLWVSILAENNVVPGIYRGEIQISISNKSIKSVPIEFEVLPIQMDRSSLNATMYLPNSFQVGGDYYGVEEYENHLKTMHDHGMSSMSVMEEVPTIVEGTKIKEFQWTNLKKGLVLRKKYHLDAPTFVMSHVWGMKEISHTYTIADDILDEKTNATVKSQWIQYCQELKKVFEQEKFTNPLVYCWDEPAYDTTGKKLLYHQALVDWCKKGGVLSTGAITLEAMQKQESIMQDYPILESPSGKLETKKRDLKMKNPWIYYHPMEHPFYDRISTGYIAWYGGYNGVAPWIYDMSSFKGGKYWDDRADVTYHYRQQNYVYRGEKGPVLTVQYKGFYEGTKDFRFMAMLEQRLFQLKGKELNETQKRWSQEVETYIHSVPAAWVGSSADELWGKLKLCDFDERREKSLRLLMESSEWFNKK